MIQTVEAVIDEDSAVRLLQRVETIGRHRALVTILNEEPASHANENALWSEPALAKDWNRPEENDAWSYLQSDQ